MLGLPASELADLTLGADTVWGSEVAAIGERMAEASSAQRAAALLLQQVVVGRLADATRPDPVVAEAVRRLMSWQAGDVTSLWSSLATSERSFRPGPPGPRVRTVDGVTPRVFLRETAAVCGCGHDHETSYAPLLPRPRLRSGRFVQERPSAPI